MKVFEAVVLEHYYDGLIFMQDNVPIHTTHKVRDWFKENGIETINWLSYSPDVTR